MVKTSQHSEHNKEQNKNKNINKEIKDNNTKLTYVIAGLAIIIVAGIIIYHYYNPSNNIKTPLPSNSSQSVPSNFSTTALQTYNSPFPSSIDGFTRFSAQLIPTSQIPQNYSNGLLNASVNIYENTATNSSLLISQLIYSNNVYSTQIFKKITSLPQNLTDVQNITILKNLSSNMFGIKAIASNKTIYSLYSYNNTKICGISYIASNKLAASENASVNMIKNITNICFSN